MSLYSNLHKSLRIPKDYYLTPAGQSCGWPSDRPIEPVPPYISRSERGDAVSRLIGEGELTSSAPNDLLDALCGKLKKLCPPVKHPKAELSPYCSKGHVFIDENTTFDTAGRRVCLTCLEIRKTAK